MLLSRHRISGQNRDIRMANKSFENVSQFKYMGTTVTYQNFIQENIKSNRILVMLATIQFRTFYFLVCCLKLKKYNIEYYNFMWFYMVVKLGL
jgi:hypothetical protein